MMWFWLIWDIGFFVFDVAWMALDLARGLWPLAILQLICAVLMAFSTIQMADNIIEVRRAKAIDKRIRDAEAHKNAWLRDHGLGRDGRPGPTTPSDSEDADLRDSEGHPRG